MDNNIYNNFSDLKYGKVFSFDGEAGIIVTGDEEVIFSKKDLSNNIDDLVKGDVVTFRINHLPFGDEVVQVAKFIKKDDNEFRRSL